MKEYCGTAHNLFRETNGDPMVEIIILAADIGYSVNNSGGVVTEHRMHDLRFVSRLKNIEKLRDAIDNIIQQMQTDDAEETSG
jgi:hypothetical protein